MNENGNELNIDLEKLLGPISAEQPSGESLRYEGTYDRIREACREDDPNLPQGVWQTRLKKADWDAVENLCVEALESRTKDLQIAAWLLDAWLHKFGFPGACEGVRLIKALCEAFWDSMYPELNGEDLEFRVSPIDWINEKLAVSLKRIAITQPESAEVAVYSLADWEAALHLESRSKKDVNVLREAEAEGKATLSKFRGSVMLTPKAYYISRFSELSDLLDAIVELERFLEEKCGNQSPSLFQFKDVAMNTQRLVSSILEEREDEPDTLEAPGFEGPAESGPMMAGEKRPGPGGPIRSRSEAYQKLSEIADYLSNVEPHSPAPYLIRRAVAWGSMTLIELLQELVQDDQDLRAIYSLLGLESRSEE